MNGLLRALYGAAGLVARAVTATGIPGDGKLAHAIAARRDLLRHYHTFGETTRDRTRPLAWFHAPSVGEGLMALPVMQRLRTLRPDVQQAYTHFSPSAATFATRTGADFSACLPFDVAAHMAAALDALQPSALVFSKVDVWPLLVNEAARRHVKLGMISAALAENSGRRGGLAAALTRDAYAALDAVGAVDDADAHRLIHLGVRPSVIRVTGDTRYDQVSARTAAAAQNAPWLARFRAQPRITLVAGSTWPADEAVLLPAWQAIAARWPGALRLIIAPHEPTPAHLAPIESWCATAALRCARLDAPLDADADVLVVDRVGVLGELYDLADAAFVGGGFHDAGLHSVIEPAAFGAPVTFGPRHGASRDAALLLTAGGASAVADAPALHRILERWCDPADPSARRNTGDAARAVVARNVGAADASTALVLSLLDR